MKKLTIICLCFTSTLVFGQQELASELYARHCGECHRENGAGTEMLERRLGEENAVLEVRTNLTPVYIKAVIRQGFGTMEKVGEEVLPDSQLNMISDYLTDNN